jgi:two-component system cell cycle sensor histidine kinase/response regulator CckA
MPVAAKNAHKSLAAPGVPFLLLAFFVVLASAIAGVAYRYYRSQKEAIEHEVQNQLLAVADLKVRDISAWNVQRIEEVRALMADSVHARMMQGLASGKPGTPGRDEIQSWLEDVCRLLHFASATFTDKQGHTILSTGRLFGDSAHLQQIAEEVVRTNQIVFHDLHVAESSGAIHMGFNLPLRTSPDAPPFGALLLGIDPADRFYPMLRTWPVPSQTAETFLVRREGDDVVFLNDLRYRRNAALQLRIPISRSELPAVQVVLGKQGNVQGVDYRGVPVFAAVRTVPDTPWFLVAKMDTEEVQAPIRRRLFLLIAATVSLILVAAAGIFALWRRQQLQFYRARYEADLERQALVGHYDYLSRFANDIILLADNTGRIIEANDRAISTYGYRREELLQRTIRELRHPSSVADFDRQWKEVEERGSMVFECLHQARDGHAIPVEVSDRFIHVGESQFRQSIIRDITERKALDERLRRMLDAFSAVIESSAAGIVSVSPDFRVTTWNKAAERMFGWTAEEAIGAIPPFVPPHRMENARRVHDGAMQGEVISALRGRGLRKDGSIIALSISAAALHDADNRCAGVALNLLDITDQTKAEEALRRNESLYRATFDQAAVGMNYCSLDGRYMRVNPKYCEITGYSQEELLQLGFREITYPGDLEGEKERAESLLSGRTYTTSRNKRYIRKDGSVVWVHVAVSVLRGDSGDPLHYVTVVEDITDWMRAEEAVRQSEERFRRVVESAPAGILVERDLRFLYVNSAAVAMFGASSAAELLGRDVLELVSAGDRAEVVERSALVANRAAVPPKERSYLRIDGSPFPVEVSAAPIEFDQQPASLVFLLDITERKQTEAEKHRLEEQLLHAQRMESLGRLAGGVAHDFNNHLTVITGYCDMLLGRLEAGDGRREEIEEIRAAGERAGTLTQQLLAFSRKQMAERKPLNLNEVVAESGKMLRRLIGEHVEIVTVLDPALGLVVADRGQMNQILMNLTINGRDAMPGGGRIDIETANVDLGRDGALPHKDAAAGSYVRLSVADTGAGMSQETIEHVFEPFFTTKGLGIGTGLGLSTVYGIVRQSGGWIQVDSRLGEGSRFQIYLPRVADVVATREPSARQAVIPGGAETILVAEDQSEVRRLALRILRSNGYELLEASSGPEALQLSRGHSGPIHLLVTDVIMPGMTGRELASRLLATRPEMKVLYVSGYTADVIGREGVLEPGVAYLPKPFTPAQLSIKVREVLGQSKSVGRILVLDDDDAVRGMLQQALSEAGYEVRSAGDGRAGMRLVAEQEFDLVLTDLVMPDQEGIETIRELRRDYPGIRIVAMSGAMDGIYLKTAELIGAHVTLCKPIETQDLVRVIRELLT